MIIAPAAVGWVLLSILTAARTQAVTCTLSGVADLAKEAAMMDYTKGQSARWDGSCVGGCVRTVLQMHVRVEAYEEDDKG